MIGVNVARKKKNPPYDSPDSVFFQSFIGEFVELRIKAPNIKIGSESFPVIEVGFLIDIDDTHFYLSDDGQSVSSAIKREDYYGIKILPKEDLMKEALDSVHIPKDRDKGN